MKQLYMGGGGEGKKEFEGEKGIPDIPCTRTSSSQIVPEVYVLTGSYINTVQSDPEVRGKNLLLQASLSRHWIVALQKKDV